MDKLKTSDLYSLEQYKKVRPSFRARVMEHKKDRQLVIGPHVILQFEDRRTIQYQVQEALRAERIMTPEAVQSELDVYNPLVPDGQGWIATLIFEFANEKERAAVLSQLDGIESRVWVQAHGGSRVWAIADDGVDPQLIEKTSAMHFLCFKLDPATIAAIQSGTAVAIGIDHPRYAYQVDPIPDDVHASIAADLD